METSLKDIIKISKTANVQFYKLVNTFIGELKSHISNKKKQNETCLHYIVPPFRFGNVVFDRKDMFNEIFKRIKDKYDVVTKCPKFKIYIKWKPKPKIDDISPILSHLDKLIITNAKKNRQSCVYTFSELVSKHECNRILRKIKKEVEKKGFDVEIQGNKLKVLWDVGGNKKTVTSVDMQPISMVRPEFLNCEIADLPRRTKLNKFNIGMPIDTRKNKSTVVEDFKKAKKKYDTHGVSTSKSINSFPKSIHTKPKKHQLSRRTILDSDDFVSQMQDLAKLNGRG